MAELTYVVDNKDNRTVLIKKRLISAGKKVADFGNEMPQDTPCFYILSPKTKLIDTEKLNCNSTVYCFFKSIENDKNITFFNMLDNEAFACKNAVLTAEGALSVVIENTPFSLGETKLLILGFGRCGKSLAELFKNLCPLSVYVTTEKNINILQCLNINYITKNRLDSKIKDYNVIINTIPDIVLDKKMLDNVNKDCFIFDLASDKGGVDFEYALKSGIFAKQFLALPSKYCPLSAAEIFYDAIFGDKEALN